MLPVTFSSRRLPTFNERITKVADGTVDPSATPESGDAIGMSALCQQQPLPSSLRSLSALWSAQSEITLGAVDVAVKACNPLPPPRGHIQVLNGGLDMRRNSFPIKLRV